MNARLSIMSVVLCLASLSACSSTSTYGGADAGRSGDAQMAVVVPTMASDISYFRGGVEITPPKLPPGVCFGRDRIELTLQSDLMVTSGPS